jgi:hypothetical protein
VRDEGAEGAGFGEGALADDSWFAVISTMMSSSHVDPGLMGLGGSVRGEEDHRLSPLASVSNRI